MLSELAHLQLFAKDRIAAMSLEEVENALETSKRQIAEYEERHRRNQEAGIHILETSMCRTPYMAKMFYETELALRERRALSEDRLTLLKELRKVRRELSYDRVSFPDKREIVLTELLIEKGGPSLADRRYSRAL